MSIATRRDNRRHPLPGVGNHDLIRVHGARVNNLKNVSVEIPRIRMKKIFSFFIRKMMNTDFSLHGQKKK